MATIDSPTAGSTQTSPPPPMAIARAHIVRLLTDIVVLPAARISTNERLVAGDILIQVLAGVDETLRVDVARRVGRVAEGPLSLTRLLMLDEPSVSREILGSNIAWPQALQIETARFGQRPHREMLVRRQDLSTAIADAILEFNEPDIARLLLRREDLVLSPAATDILVARSALDRELQMLLLRRRELEPAHGFVMFWWVDGECRRRILQRFSMNRTTIQDSLQTMYPEVFTDDSPDPIVKEVLVFLDRRHRPRGVSGEIVTMDIVRKTLSFAKRHPEPDVVHAVGLIAGIGRELAGRILRDDGGEPFAIMCKAVGMSRDDFYSIMSKDADGAPKDKLLEVFDSISRDFSRAALRYWDWRGNPRIMRITHLLGEGVGEAT